MSVDENASVVYLTATDFESIETQPQNEYLVSTSKATTVSGSTVFAADPSLGLPYQDHNYGAQPPSASRSGRQRVNSHTYNQSMQYQGPNVHQPVSKQAILQQHQGNQVTIRGQFFSPPSLDRSNSGFLDDETSLAVDFLSPANFSSDQNDRSALFYETGNGFSGGQTLPRYPTFKPDTEIEVGSSTAASNAAPSVNLLGDFQLRLGSSTPRGIRPTLTPSSMLASAFDGESHSYCVPRNVNGLSSSASLLGGPPPRAPRVPRRPRAAFQGGPQDGQQMYATNTQAPYVVNHISAHSRLYPNMVEQHLISPESLTTIQSSSMDRNFVGSDVVLGSVLSSPPPNFDAFPNNIESAPYQPSTAAWSTPRGHTGSRPLSGSNFGAGGLPMSASVGKRTMDTSALSSSKSALPAVLRAAGFTDADVIIPIDLPDDPTSEAVGAAVAAATVDVVDSATSPTTTTTAIEMSPDLVTSSATINAKKNFAGDNATSENFVLTRLFDKLGVDAERQTKLTPKKKRTRTMDENKVARRRATSKQPETTLPQPPAADHQEHSNTDTDDEEGESDEKRTAASTGDIKRLARQSSTSLSDVEEADEDEEGGSEEEMEVEPVEKSDSSDDGSSDEWAGRDYTTKCLCDMTHNDEFMIQCDQCEVWQHCDCVGLKKKAIPDNFVCHFCQPRELTLTKDEARQVQTKKKRNIKERSRRLQKRKQQNLQRRQNEKKRKHEKFSRQKLTNSSALRAALAKKKLSSNKRSSDHILGPPRNAKRRAEVLRKSEVVEEFYANFTKIETNDYTQDAKKALLNEEDTMGAGWLDQLPIGAPCLVMYVTKERRGLVANLTIPPDQPILEFRGRVCSVQHEFNGRDADGRVLPYVLFYRGLRKGDGSSQPLDDLCVDARFRGTDARFVRRSCQPNTQVKHVIKDNELHFLLISTELIESATEVTIPFDYDFRACTYDVECACKILGNSDCPVERSNTQNRLSRSDSATPPPSKMSKSVKSPEDALKEHKIAPPKRSRMKSTTKSSADQPHEKPRAKAGLGFKVKLKIRNEANVENTAKTLKKVETRSPIRKVELPVAKKDKKPKVQAPPVDQTAKHFADMSDADAREEKKLRSLINQIAKMEEREKKKAERRRESMSSGGEIHDGLLTKRSRARNSLSSGTDKVDVNSPLPARTEQENVKATDSFTPIPQPHITEHSAVYPSASTYIAERNVAKKRWLRLALSEESSKQNSYNASNENHSANFCGFTQQTTFAHSAVDTMPSHATATVFAYASTDTQAIADVIGLGHLPSESSTSPDIHVNVNVERDLHAAEGDSPSSSLSVNNDDLTANIAAKKKVRMSLDEYKKRKVDAPISKTPGEPDFQMDDESVSVSASMTPTDSSSKLSSFIPQLKETDLLSQSVRLSYLPDPNSIGKSSATLDDLRRRIYGSFKNIGGADNPGLSEMAEQVQLNQALNDSPEHSRHRMSLMDRLKMEFGLDDHT